MRNDKYMEGFSDLEGWSIRVDENEWGPKQPFDTVADLMSSKGYGYTPLTSDQLGDTAGVKSWFRGSNAKLTPGARHAAMYLEKAFPASQGWSIKPDQTIQQGNHSINVNLLVENRRLNEAHIIAVDPYRTRNSKNFVNIHNGAAAHMYGLTHPGMNVSSSVLSVGHNTLPLMQITPDRTKSVTNLLYPNPLTRMMQENPTKVEAQRALQNAKSGGLGSGLPKWKGSNFKGTTFTSLDIETGGWGKGLTGTWESSRREILSISAVKFGQDKATGQWYELGRYNRFYNPTDTTSPDYLKSYEVHGLSSTKLKALRKAYGMPTLVTSYTSNEAKKLGRFIKDSTIVTHNGAQFDIPHLQRWGNSLIQGSGHIDTMIAAQNWQSKGPKGDTLSVFENYGLADVYQQIFDHQMPGHHFAENDAVATLQVAVDMMSKQNPTADAMRYIATHKNTGLIKTEFGTDQVTRGWGVGGVNINGKVPYNPGDILFASEYLKEAQNMAIVGDILKGNGSLPISVFDIDGTTTDTYSIGKDITKAFDAGDFQPFYDTKHMVSPEAIAQIVSDVRSGKQVYFNSASLGTEFRGKKLPFAEAPDFNLDRFLQAGVSAKQAQFQEILKLLPKDVAKAVRGNLIVTQPALGETKAGALIKKLGFTPNNIDIYEDEQRQLDAYLKEIPNARTHNVLPSGFTFNGRFWAPDAPLPPTFPAASQPIAPVVKPKKQKLPKVIDQLPNQKTPEEEAVALQAAAAKAGVPLNTADAGNMHEETPTDYAASLNGATMASSMAETQGWFINNLNSLSSLLEEQFIPGMGQFVAAKNQAVFKGAAKYDAYGSAEEQAQVLRKLHEGGVASAAKSWSEVDADTKKRYQLFRDDYMYDQSVLNEKREEKARDAAFKESVDFNDSRERMKEYVEDAYFGDKLHSNQYHQLMQGIDEITDKDGLHDMYRQIHRSETISRAMDKQDAEEDRVRAKKYGWNKSFDDSLSSVATKGEEAASSLEKVAKALGAVSGYNYERINKAFSSQLSDIHSSLGGLIPSGFQKPVGHLFAATQNAWNRYWAPRREAIQRAEAFRGAVEAIPFFGGKLTKGADLISSLHGPSLERQIVEKGQMWSQTFNILSAGASMIGPLIGLIKDLIMAPIKLLGSALKMLAGLIGGITGILFKGMKNYAIPTTGLTGVTTRSLAGWEAADTAFGLGKGTMNDMINGFGQQRTMLYTMGKFNQDRLVASAMLGVFSSVYNSTGTAEENFEATADSLLKQYRGAKSPQEKEKLMALAAQIDSNLPNMIETMSVLGMRSVSQYKDPSQFGVYWNPRGSSTWDKIAQNRGFSSESQRLRQNYYEFDNSRVQFQMSISRIASWIWESFGKEIFSGLNQALDMAAQGNWQGLLDWAADLISKIGNVLKQVLEKANIKDWLRTLLDKLKEAIEFIGNIEIDGVSIKDRIINLFETISQAIFDVMNDLISTLNSMEIHPEALLPGHDKSELITFASSKNRDIGATEFLSQGLWGDNSVAWFLDKIGFEGADIDKSTITSTSDMYRKMRLSGAQGYIDLPDENGDTVRVSLPDSESAFNDMVGGLYQTYRQQGKFHRGLLGKEWYRKHYINMGDYRKMQLVHFGDVVGFGKDRVNDIADEAAGSAAVAKAAGANIWNSLITGANNGTITIRAQGEDGTSEKIAEISQQGVTMTNKQILLDGKWMFITREGDLIPQTR